MLGYDVTQIVMIAAKPVTADPVRRSQIATAPDFDHQSIPAAVPVISQYLICPAEGFFFAIFISPVRAINASRSAAHCFPAMHLRVRADRHPE